MTAQQGEQLKWFIGRVSYDVNVKQWVKGGPCVFFHPEGNSMLNLIGFVDCVEEQAAIVCLAHNGRIRRGEQVMFDRGFDLTRGF